MMTCAGKQARIFQNFMVGLPVYGGRLPGRVVLALKFLLQANC
jgi:hypothetical protein